MTYGYILMQLREQYDLTKIKVAEMLGISDSLYSRYEKEKQLIPIKYLIILADYYNVSLDYIFSFAKERNYKGEKKGINKQKAGNRLRLFRKENKLTQSALADELHTAFSVISGYERGKFIISTSFLYDLCKKYKISSDYLLGKTDSPKSYK